MKYPSATFTRKKSRENSLKRFEATIASYTPALCALSIQEFFAHIKIPAISHVPHPGTYNLSLFYKIKMKLKLIKYDIQNDCERSSLGGLQSHFKKWQKH